MNSTTANVPTTDKEDYSFFPYFETHNFKGWARQFRTLADSTDECSLAFLPEPQRPTDEDGSPVDQTPAQLRELAKAKTKWQAADKQLTGLLARALRWNPATKTLFEQEPWTSAADLYERLVERCRLCDEAYRACALADLFNFEAGDEGLRAVADCFDHKVAILRNLDELISDAMKVTLLTRALASSKNSLHIRVADALRVSPQQFNYAQLTKIILDFYHAPPPAAAFPAQPQVFAIGEGDSRQREPHHWDTGPPRKKQRYTRGQRGKQSESPRRACDLCGSRKHRTARCYHLKAAQDSIKKIAPSTATFRPRDSHGIRPGSARATGQGTHQLRWSGNKHKTQRTHFSGDRVNTILVTDATDRDPDDFLTMEEESNVPEEPAITLTSESESPTELGVARHTLSSSSDSPSRLSADGEQEEEVSGRSMRIIPTSEASVDFLMGNPHTAAYVRAVIAARRANPVESEYDCSSCV